MDDRETRATGDLAARAAATNRQRTGDSGPGSEAIDDPHQPNSR